jgi:STE24 endopeptidase
LKLALALAAALVIELGISHLADLLNLASLDAELPREFRDVYDRDTYRRSQAYTRERTRFGMLTASLRLALLFAFWFAGGFDAVDQFLRRFALGPIWTGLAFFAVLALANGFVSLPLGWWSTFVIEQRFGFNRTTPRTFWGDLAKGVLLAVVLGGPLLAAILWLFERAGNHAWIYGWMATTAVTMLLQYVAPTWIMPLFNKFERLGSGDLRDAILAYARAVAFPVEGVFVIDGSRRSTKANAFFTGFGRRKRIALFDTLLGRLGTGEVLAVVAHEIGHYKRRHVLKGIAISVAQTGLLFWLVSLVLQSHALYDAFFMTERSVHAGLVFFAIALAPLELAVSVGLHALSRRHEREADAFAVETIGSGEHLATGLKRLSAESLSNLTPHPFYVLLHYSHPPVLERIAALRSRVAA